MKLISTLICAACLYAGAAHAQEPSASTSNIETTTKITQFLAARICGDKANLDPATIREKSGAFLFVHALHQLASTELIDKKKEALAEKLKTMHCDADGVLTL
jgi:hypothetical protein